MRDGGAGLGRRWAGRECGAGSEIARSAGRPVDSIKSLIKAVERDGLAALHDRRRGDTSPAKATAPQAASAGPWELLEQQDALVLHCGVPEAQLLIPWPNALQKKVVLLSAVHSGLLSAADVAPRGWASLPPTPATSPANSRNRT